MGYALTMPIFRYLAGCPVICYVHYPTISTDMLSVVERRESAFNNRSIVAQSRFLSAGKLFYYRAFAKLYGLAGRCANFVMVNSTWTCGHINTIWGAEPTIVYPPCDVQALIQPENVADALANEIRIVSIGQFRPEKNHKLQLEAFQLFRNTQETSKDCVCRLVLIGSCRNEEDRGRLAALKQYANELGLREDETLWYRDVPFEELSEQCSKALIGLHTMRNEHFGIGKAS